MSLNEFCRVCGSALKGNQRRWIFGKQQTSGTKTSPGNRSLTVKGGREWGSCASLNSPSTASSSSPNSRMDLLAILTHVLGREIPRKDGRGEFLCGKCVSVLERVFKFDTVIARVRTLSLEKLQRLASEKEKMCSWMSGIYTRRHFNSRKSNTSVGDRMSDVDSSDGYQAMLRENMALSEYEWWSEKWDACPYYRKTGKCCQKGKNCEGCNALRVSDSDYESVCGVPRRLANSTHLQNFSPSPFASSRDKSRSMPLDWLNRSYSSFKTSRKCSSTLSVGSSQSLSCDTPGPTSRSNSVLSLDSEGFPDPFDWPVGDIDVTSPVLMEVLRKIREIEYRPVQSPPRSKIPVRDRAGEGRGGTPGRQERGGVGGLQRALSFGESLDGENEEDVLTELRDEYLPLNRGKLVERQKMHTAVRQLRGQLEQAQAQIRTLQEQLEDGATHPVGASKNPAPSSLISKEWHESQAEAVLIDSLGDRLHSTERIAQECIALLQRLSLGASSPAELRDSLIEKLQERLKERDEAIERAAEAKFSELKAMEREVQSLRQTAREKDRDLARLATVLQSNEDTIHALRWELSQREGALRERQSLLEREREAWTHRDTLQTGLLAEREALLRTLQGALESSQRDVQALSESVIGQGLEGAGAAAQLANQLQEKEAMLGQVLREQKEQSDAHWQEVKQLLTALESRENIIQEQSAQHSQALSQSSLELCEAQRELRERERERAREESGAALEREREERGLRSMLVQRDRLIQQVLANAEEKDGLLFELQQQIREHYDFRTGMKQTL
ncbi:uncharacterized protein LOC117433700 isoform X1 [Acipenser ruthenus]|uniref:uncharacterized protein LOC117433700 isoform X1 n=1 Tax=Acipenser ruthenus TaxID=7906 RepID=UPI0027405F3C|nr:uncharacterized protein LOC117433700 isoform X1 [Acipenser ruthenus]